MPGRSEVENIAAQLTPEEQQDFGFARFLKAPAWHYTWVDGTPSLDRMMYLARQKIKQRERQSTAAAEPKGESPVEQTTMQGQLETGKITAIEPAGEQEQVMDITAETMADLTTKITESVGMKLHRKIDQEIENGITLAVVTDGDSYKKASEQRKALKALVNLKPDLMAADRLRVRVSLAIMEPGGQNRIGIVRETTVGTTSLLDFYDPLADLLHKLHRATTQGRNDAEQRIEAVRGMLEKAVLDWDAENERKKKEAEEKQRLENEQIARTDRARHWIGLLCEHGYKVETLREILDHDLPLVTDAEVETLENLLREKLVAEETEKQERERKEAIQTAKDLGLSDAVKELEEEAGQPVAVVAPPPPPPPPARPVAAAVAQSFTPDIKGQGKTKKYKIIIDDPTLIPAEFLLPPENKLYDPDAYPRLRNEARNKGLRMNVPGVRVEEVAALTQR